MSTAIRSRFTMCKRDPDAEMPIDLQTNFRIFVCTVGREYFRRIRRRNFFGREDVAHDQEAIEIEEKALLAADRIGEAADGGHTYGGRRAGSKGQRRRRCQAQHAREGELSGVN